MSGDAGLIQPVGEADRVSIAFRSVCTWADNLELEKSTLSRLSSAFKKYISKENCTNALDEKQILFNLNGEVEPGEVLALMGPSGSGKTTLVSALGGRLSKKIKMKGKIMVNNQPISKAWRRKIGFVTQDDMMYGTLTVQETLQCAASLRLPNDMSRAEKQKRVEEVIAALGLEKCQDTLIGDAKIKGVSGGERKRVAVGHELVANPSSLILDEPTSGLDSTKALQLIMILRELARGGRSVIATIHQPSSRLYKQLDNLMLLSEGHAMYYGRADLAMHWFKSIGYPVPMGMNTADFIVDLANGDASGAGIQRSRLELLKQLTSAFQPFALKTKGLSSKADIEHLGIVPSKEPELELPVLDVDKMTVQDVTEPDRSGAGYFEQVRVLTKRAIKTKRFESLNFHRFLQVAGPGAIGGLLWWQSGGDSTVLGALNVGGLLFFEILYIQVESGFGAMRTFPPVCTMMIKERASGMYRLSAFYAAMSLSELPVDLCFPLLFAAFMYWGGGLRATAAAFIGHLFAVVLGVLVSQGIGMLIGAWSMDEKHGITWSSMLFIVMFMTGGFYIRALPAFAAWLKYINPNFYNFNIVMKLEYSGRSFVNCGGLGARKPDEEGKIECQSVTSLKESLTLAVDVDDSIWPDVGAMLLMMIIFRTLVYIAIKRKSSLNAV